MLERGERSEKRGARGEGRVPSLEVSLIAPHPSPLAVRPSLLSPRLSLFATLALLSSLFALRPLAAEDRLDRARELADDGDAEGQAICLAILEEQPTDQQAGSASQQAGSARMRAWVELFRSAAVPRDQALLDRAERLRAAWERRSRGKTGPLVVSALALLLPRDVSPAMPRFTIVLGLGGEERGAMTQAQAAAESVLRRAERIDAGDQQAGSASRQAGSASAWVAYARFLLDRSTTRGDDTPRRIARLAAPLEAALARDPDNIVLLEALSTQQAGSARLPDSGTHDLAERRLLEVASREHPRLLPWFRMAALKCGAGRTDVEALERLFEETKSSVPDSRYLDDMAFRLGDAFHREKEDPRAARRYYEEVVRLDRGNCLGPACLALADLLVDEFDDGRGAVELLRAYHSRGLGSTGRASLLVGDPIYASSPENVLFRMGEIQRSRMHAPAEAAESFLEGIAEARAGGRDLGAGVYYVLAAGDCLADAGRYREAMGVYGQYQALVDSPSPELWGRWMACYLRVSPYFTISMGLTALLTALSAILSTIVLVSRWRRARRYVVAAAAFTLVVGGTQLAVHGVLLGVPKADLLWTGLLSARTFLVVPAGMVLAAGVGMRMPHGRRVVRSVAAGLLAALVMGAITWGFYQWKEPRASELLQFLWDPLREGELGAIREPRAHPVAAVLLVMTAGVAEELTCRLFFLGLLVRCLRGVRGRWVASIAVVSLFWAIAHAGMVEPEAWKLGQVFALGLVLGVVARREGILACIVAHAAFNAVGVWV